MGGAGDKWISLVILLASTELVISSQDICTACQCITRYFPSPYSFYFTDITCNASSNHRQIDFNELSIEDNVHVSGILISGFDKVVLNTDLLISDTAKRPFLLQRNINVWNISELVIESWSSFTNYSIININDLKFSWDLSADDVVLDSLLIKNSSIRIINSGNLYFDSFKEKVILVDVSIHNIDTGGIKLHSHEPSSIFLMADSKIGQNIKKDGMDVTAENIVITKCKLEGSTRHIRLNGTNKIVLRKNRIEQINNHRDFFNLYSPSILLLKNHINKYVNNTLISRING